MNKGIRMQYFFIVILSFIIFSCFSYKVHEKWLNAPPYNFVGEKIDYILIPSMYADEYFKLLYKEQYCFFPKDVFKEITGFQSTKNYTIAIRAVYTNLGGRYEVLQNDNGEISINYRVLGKVTKIKKSILLLQVDILPSNIYISYTGAR